jgi:hypothetical protein
MENEATGANDFDFLIGSWRVHHCRLKERLADNHEWIEFEGTCAMQKILGGAGNMDDNVLDFPGDAIEQCHYAPMMRRRNNGRFGGSMRATQAISIRLWSADSRTASERFTPTILLKENRFAFAFCGRISPPNRIGSRRSPTMEAKRGKLTGSWNS